MPINDKSFSHTFCPDLFRTHTHNKKHCFTGNAPIYWSDKEFVTIRLRKEQFFHIPATYLCCDSNSKVIRTYDGIITLYGNGYRPERHSYERQHDPNKKRTMGETARSSPARHDRPCKSPFRPCPQPFPSGLRSYPLFQLIPYPRAENTGTPLLQQRPRPQPANALARSLQRRPLAGHHGRFLPGRTRRTARIHQSGKHR